MTAILDIPEPTKSRREAQKERKCRYGLFKSMVREQATRYFWQNRWKQWAEEESYTWAKFLSAVSLNKRDISRWLRSVNEWQNLLQEV